MVDELQRKSAVEAVPDAQAGASDDQFVVRALARGLAMLNLFDAEHREWSLDEMAEHFSLPHPRRMPNMLTDPVDLARELDKVREEGVAFDLAERDLGTCAVVAPVRGQMGEMVATLGVVVPTGRFGPAQRTACAEAVKRVAASLSAFLVTPSLTAPGEPEDGVEKRRAGARARRARHIDCVRAEGDASSPALHRVPVCRRRRCVLAAVIPARRRALGSVITCQWRETILGYRCW